MVQEQRLQLKMKFLLGYNMKIVVFWGGIEIWRGHFSWWRKTIQGSCWWWNFSEINFCNKDSERNKLLGVSFHSSQPNWEICRNDFYIPKWKVEICYNLALQPMIFWILIHIFFSLNNSYFHFQGRISIPQFNNVNQTICHFAEIFVEFSLDNKGCNYELNWNKLW